jgi:hypothetical protein
MDQVKTFARAAAKHIFWIGCGLILAASMASWFMARGALETEFDKNLGDIDSKDKTVSGLMQKTSIPNDHSHKHMDQLLESTLQLVLQAWDHQYSKQETILRWPMELQQDFVAAVRPLKPIELKVEYPTPPNKELQIDLRKRYSEYAHNLLPKLADMIGTTWQVGQPAVGTMGTPMAPSAADPRARAARKPAIVDWSAQDQARLAGMHFDWSSQRDAAPTTLQVLYAQEDLWVLTALMYIIRQTNGDVEARHEAVVKSIETVLIGRAAIGLAGQVTRLGGPGGGMGAPGGMYGGDSGASYAPYDSSGMPSSEAGSGGMGSGADYTYPAGGSGMDTGGSSMPGGYSMGGPSMGGPTGASASRDPGQFRYVDNEYQPLQAERLRSALRSANPEDAFLVVAKRMPVRLRLVVDQRKLPRLLAQCGNSPLPVEVRQVRANRGKSTGGGAAYGGGGGYPSMGFGGGDMMGFGSGTMGGMDSGSESGYGYSAGGPSYGFEGGATYGGPSYGEGFGTSAENLRERTEVSSTSAYDVPVEIYGIIYIYNPVDREKLGLDQQPALTGPVQPPAPSTS